MKKITTLVLALTFIMGLTHLAVAADDSAMGDKMMKKDTMMKGDDMMKEDSMSDLGDTKESMMNNEAVNDDAFGDEDLDSDSMPATPAAK